MDAVALVLLAGAACSHAGWNFIAKRAGESGQAFVWMVNATGSVLYLPVVVFVLLPLQVTPYEAFAMFVSGVLHLVYHLILMRGYRHGALSVVYPVARGGGPLIAMVGAIVLLGERPTPIAVAGGLLVVVGVLAIGGLRLSRLLEHRSGFVAGSVIAVAIASYTLWDGYVIRSLLISPFLLGWVIEITRAGLLTPSVIRRPHEVRDIWRRNRLAVLGVGVLSPLSYVFILGALTRAPVSYVAPAREFSIVIATFLGARLLREGRVRERVPGAVLVVGGVAAIALG